MNFECEGILYRGDDPERPTEVWDYPRRAWAPYRQETLPRHLCRIIDDAEAEALKTNNPAAEHFMYYDTPPWAQPVGEEYRRAVAPEGLRRSLK